jgi:hypothetical protein
MARKPECVDCIAEGITRWRPTDGAPRRPRCATHARAHRRSQARAQRAKRLERVYGVTPEQENAYRARYGHLCIICGAVTGHHGRCLDHDHETGAPRGFLCHTCNRLLGEWREDPAIFARAIRYLRHPPFDFLDK